MGGRYSVSEQDQERTVFLEKLEHQLATGGCRPCGSILEKYPTPELAVAASVRERLDTLPAGYNGRDLFRG